MSYMVGVIGTTFGTLLELFTVADYKIPFRVETK